MIGAVRIFGLGRARGTRSALARLRYFPFRPNKILSHRLACIATSCSVNDSDANDFAHVKNQNKEISARGQGTTLITRFVVLPGW